jgi:hypothetical protein
MGNYFTMAQTPTFKTTQVQKVKHGLYKIYWKSGGSSLGAVGSGEKDRWFMPTNWISGPSYDWKLIDRVELLVNEV